MRDGIVTRFATARGLSRAALATALAWAAACGGNDLGECNMEAAQQLVFGRNNLVATKGQALLHDSCGNGVFCHSSAADGSSRKGVPNGMNFDVLPAPKHLKRIVAERESIWQQIDDGEMPPKGWQAGESDWMFDRLRPANGLKLGNLKTWEGKAAVRNWLACGAPAVEKTTVPASALPPPPAEPNGWSGVHAQLRASCVAGGCHDGIPSAPNMGNPETPAGIVNVPFVSSECVVFRWLMYNRMPCGDQGKLVEACDLPGSALVRKLEGAADECRKDGTKHNGHPSIDQGKLAAVLASVRTWVEKGANAPQCGDADYFVKRDKCGSKGPVTWAQIHRDIIKPSCAVAACHVASRAADSGNLNLEDVCGARKALLSSGTSCGVRVVPGQPDASLLIDVMTNPNPRCSDPMPPPPASPLPRSQIDQIREWIQAGAVGGDCP